MSGVRGRVWRSGKPQDDFSFEAISDLLDEPDALVWVDVCDPDHETLRALADELGLNTWAVEDAIAPMERTKATTYRTHTFFTVYAVTTLDVDPADESSSRLTRRRISAFVLPRGLITVHLPAPDSATDAHGPGWDREPGDPPSDGPIDDAEKDQNAQDGAGDHDPTMAEVSRRFDELGGQEHGVGALVHGLLDVVVDGHFAAVQVLDDAIEGLEDELFTDSPARGLQRRTFALRKDLVALRRVVLPMREVVNAIQHRRLDAQTSPELDPLYADLYDHVLRASEWTESLRDMVTTVFETNLSLQDARLNVVMKKLTSWAAIIAVPTAITGFYGQNVKYPGIDSVAGFVASSVVIVALVALLYVTFKRRDWL